MDPSGQYVMRETPAQEKTGRPRSKHVRTATAVSPSGSGDTSCDQSAEVAADDGQAGPGASRQIVALMPSDGTSDHVSYVIIGQPDTAEDLTLKEVATTDEYDPDDADERRGKDESGDEDGRRCVTRPLSRRSSQSRSHIKSHSVKRSSFKCSVCGRIFTRLASLQNHVNMHTGTKPHSCMFCKASFTTSGEVVRHVRYIHTKEKPHACSECEYASVELSELKRHKRSHSGERPYQCPQCTYASVDMFKLKRHLRVHTGEKPYECKICGSRFTQSNSLKAHSLLHSGDKAVFKCEQCPSTCGRKIDLWIHVQKLHTSNEPIKCKRCGNNYPDRYSYKVHRKTHEGEKSFRCDLCPYASTARHHLNSHMLIHTDQKPFVCQICDQGFRQKQLLKRHVNVYHNPDYVAPPAAEKRHECPKCGRQYRHKGYLTRHMAVHDPGSGAAEKQRTLQLGRETKAATLGQELLHHEEGEEGRRLAGEQTVHSRGVAAAGQREVVADQGQDGQQYVVLEVVHLQGADGEEEAVAVVPDSAVSRVVGCGQDSVIDRQLSAEVSLTDGLPAGQGSVIDRQLAAEVSLTDGLPAGQDSVIDRQLSAEVSLTDGLPAGQDSVIDRQLSAEVSLTDGLPAGQGSVIDRQLSAEVSLTDGLPAGQDSVIDRQMSAEVSLTDGLPTADDDGGTGPEPEQPRRTATTGRRRRVDNHAVQKSKQDVQNCFGFDDDDDPVDFLATGGEEGVAEMM